MKKKFYAKKSGKKVYRCVNTKDKSERLLDADGKEYKPEDVIGIVCDETEYWKNFRNDVAASMLPAIFRARPSFEPEEAVKNAVRFANALAKELKEDREF